MMEVRVQAEAFDVGAEMVALTQGRGDIGALVSFTGLVRGGAGDTLELEHYPGMTERRLVEIADVAETRWSLSSGLIVHRYGKLAAGELIVLVLAASPHRADAFAAADYMMDMLKTNAPFWKKETSPGETRWVNARASDDAAAARWD
ncbi:MAG: molybdenum cofactor biosynthesis protein MoaE [Pacificimonas sp.]